MSVFFTPHARDRFQERYGIRPSIRDLSDIPNACKSGRAVTMRTAADGGKTYCFDLRGIKVFPFVRDEMIISFMPPDFFLASSAKKHRLESGKAKGKPAKERDPNEKMYPRREPYKRERLPMAKLVEEL